MMFLGNTEALAVIRQRLAAVSNNRLLTFGLMSMSEHQRLDHRIILDDGSVHLCVYSHPAELLKRAFNRQYAESRGRF